MTGDAVVQLAGEPGKPGAADCGQDAGHYAGARRDDADGAARTRGECS